MSSGVIGWLFEMVMGVRLAQGGADQAPIAHDERERDREMPATWGNAAENRGWTFASVSQVHGARFAGSAVAAEGGKIGEEFLGLQPVFWLGHEFGDGLRRQLHQGNAQEDARIEIRADGRKHRSQRLQHVVAAVGGVGKDDRFADDMLARDQPVDCVLEPAGEGADIFGASDDQAVGFGDFLL
jgi:hypothetical protein